MAFDYENYYRLEYLESSGTQYIDPGITESIYLTVDCKFGNPSPVGHYLFGAQQNSSNMMYNGLYSSTDLEYNWSTIYYPSSTTVELQQYLSSDTLYSIINGASYSSAFSTSNTSSGASFYIFACLNSSGAIRLYASTLKLYYFTIRNTEDQAVLRSLIPAQLISDGTLGLYDEVNNTFYTNAGTGTFIAGPIIVASPVSMEKGISIPATVSTDNTVYYTTQSTAFTGLGYSSAAVSTSTVSVPSNNGAQSWAGTKNEFTGTGTCTGFDDEGFVNEGAAVTVTGLNAMIPAGMGVAKAVVADVAYNAVWNDIVDCIEVPDDTELEYGRAYCFDGEKFYFSTKYLDDGYIGIHSDTAGMFMGNKQVNKQLRVASAGFVLAYVDKTYPPGTPLTVAENGTLTKLKEEDIEKNPHKLVGTFWKDEPLLWWGFDLAWSDNLLVEVKGRKWIKVK